MPESGLASLNDFKHVCCDIVIRAMKTVSRSHEAYIGSTGLLWRTAYEAGALSIHYQKTQRSRLKGIYVSPLTKMFNRAGRSFCAE